MQFKKYSSRKTAGKAVATFIKEEYPDLHNDIIESPNDHSCFSVANGGVSVAEGFCEEVNLKFTLIIVRKIKIPYNPEAGFGSVTSDGTVLINHPLVKQLSLSQNEINYSIELTKEEIRNRLNFYQEQGLLSEDYDKYITNKIVILLDDGLASGFTMLAAINMVKNYSPKKVIVAVPTAPKHTIDRIKNRVDAIVCPNIRDVLRFAVADAFEHWRDVPDDEVLDIIKTSKAYFR